MLIKHVPSPCKHSPQKAQSDRVAGQGDHSQRPADVRAGTRGRLRAVPDTVRLQSDGSRYVIAEAGEEKIEVYSISKPVMMELFRYADDVT